VRKETNSFPYGLKVGKGTASPSFLMGWGAGEGRYKAHYTRFM